MNRLIILSITIALAMSCGTTRKGKTASKAQHRYIPVLLHNTYLGMPLTEFQKARQEAKLEKEENFRSIYLEMINSAEIKDIAYYFGTQGTLPLYEYIIEYQSAKQRDKAAQALLGPANNDKEWLLDTGDGFKLKAWTFQNKLVLVGAIEGTEWYEEFKK